MLFYCLIILLGEFGRHKMADAATSRAANTIVFENHQVK